VRRRFPGIDRILRVSGGELAALRRSQGLSQNDLAELTGLHRNTVANVERGSLDPSVLAMSLMQVQLRASGVFVEEDGFYPCPPPSASCGFPFPRLVVPPSTMARIMGGCARRRRSELGMSLAELADAAGLHLNTVWNFERGLVEPSVSTTYLIYRGLDVAWVGGSEEGLRFE
jgi:transcriptional regulator with XRE-family HTH domain